MSLLYMFTLFTGLVLRPTPVEPVIHNKQEIRITHLGFLTSDVRQEYVTYAYLISDKDMDFVLTLEAENGLWKHDRKAINKKEDSRGFCQLNRRWHSDIVDDPRFLSNPYWQLSQCFLKYKTGTRFYGYDKRLRLRNRFIVR